MKKILLIFIYTITLLLSYSCSEDEPIYIYGNIAGKVTEEGGNNAIEGATVEINGIEQSVKTGSNGMFKFEKLPADNYTIYVSKDGYVADSKVVTVVATQTVQSDFSLLKNLPETNPSEVVLTTTNASSSIELTNTRSRDMNFTIHTSKPWIIVTPTSGTIASKNTKIIKISADYSTIDYGEYVESIVINVGQSSLSIPVQISYYKPAYIEITSPEQGCVYSMGNVLPIMWNSNIGGTVKIELVRNGSIQQSITSSVDNCNVGSHSWGIPSLSVDAYQVLITSNESPNISCLSKVFYIEEGPTPPIVTTGEVIAITSSNITVLGHIEDLGKTYTNVVQHGHVYSETNPTPTISDYKYNHGSTTKLTSYSTNLTNLKPNTRYYIRAYAENPKGIAYGTTISVTTKTLDGTEPWQPTEPDETGAVDLGLSVKWAAYNLGATSPEEYGNYYAWGELESKNDYIEGNYKFAEIAYGGGYYNYELPNGLYDISGTEHDVATTIWGNGWRIPNKLELFELINNTSSVSTTYKDVKGTRIIGPNGNSIFIPNAGFWDMHGIQGKGTFSYLWSSIVRDDYIRKSYCVEAINNVLYMLDMDRYMGMSIRAVRN